MALVSMMFLLMVRMTDKFSCRARCFGVLNTFLWLSERRGVPATEAFPGWMKVIAVIDPFTYAVHAIKCLIPQEHGVWGDWV